MAINNSWDVSECEVYPSKNNKSNVVHTVHWRLTAIDNVNNDADGEPQRSTTYGVQNLNTHLDLSDFINWSDLTASDVQGWVETAMGSTEVARLKSSLDGMITQQISPSSVTKTLT